MKRGLLAQSRGEAAGAHRSKGFNERGGLRSSNPWLTAPREATEEGSAKVAKDMSRKAQGLWGQVNRKLRLKDRVD